VTPEARQNILNHFLKIREPTYGEKFKLAVQLGPMVDEYDVIDPVTCEETCMHFFSMPWKILFAFIPSSHIGGGWPTFITALGVMVGITYVISELATAIGCLLNMCTAIQALTIISLGFNLPEFYASQLAAEGHRSINAEPAIGFIPGANAMKIFLGLGLPWTIKSILKSSSGAGILCIGIDHTGDLSFVALLLAVLSLLVFLILMYRRATNKGELGGETCSRALSSCFLVVLWFVFVVIVSLNCFDYLKMKDVFTPASCGQVGTHCPGPMMTPFTTDGPEYIEIHWSNEILQEG
jgi:hypothetical protein